MKLRPGSEYAGAIRRVLPTSEENAPHYCVIAQQIAGRLCLTANDLCAVRPNGWRRLGGKRFANQHRSTLSAVLLRMKVVGEVLCTGSASNRRYWLAPQARYAGVICAPSCEEIARHAYEIYAKRGYVDGCDKQDWLQAERELRGEKHG